MQIEEITEIARYLGRKYPTDCSWEDKWTQRLIAELSENRLAEMQQAIAIKKRLMGTGAIREEDGELIPEGFDREYVVNCENKPQQAGARGLQRRYGCDPMHHQLRYDGAD